MHDEKSLTAGAELEDLGGMETIALTQERDVDGGCMLVCVCVLSCD